MTLIKLCLTNIKPSKQPCNWRKTNSASIAMHGSLKKYVVLCIAALTCILYSWSPAADNDRRSRPPCHGSQLHWTSSSKSQQQWRLIAINTTTTTNNYTCCNKSRLFLPLKLVCCGSWLLFPYPQRDWRQSACRASNTASQAITPCTLCMANAAQAREVAKYCIINTAPCADTSLHAPAGHKGPRCCRRSRTTWFSVLRSSRETEFYCDRHWTSCDTAITRVCASH